MLSVGLRTSAASPLVTTGWRETFSPPSASLLLSSGGFYEFWTLEHLVVIATGPDHNRLSRKRKIRKRCQAAAALSAIDIAYRRTGPSSGSSMQIASHIAARTKAI